MFLHTFHTDVATNLKRNVEIMAGVAVMVAAIDMVVVDIDMAIMD